MMTFDITEYLAKLPPIPWVGMRTHEVIGIDIGSASIKIVQLKGEPGKYQLTRWAIIYLSNLAEEEKQETAELSPKEKKTIATSLLRNYRTSGKNIPKNVVASISGSSVIVRYVKFQKLTRKELSKTIKMEAEPYIPFNVDEVYIGFHPLRDVISEGKSKMETVLVAAKQDSVHQKVEIREGAGFKPVMMDVDAFALEAVYDAAFPTALQETVLIANIGRSQTNFVIVEKGLSLVVKDSLISGNSVNKMIIKNLGVNLETAEKLKMSHSLLVSQQEKENALNTGKRQAIGVSNALATLANDLIAEIKKLIEFYNMRGSDKQISRMIISGGSSNIKNLIPFFSKELNLPVEKLNPFMGIAGAETVPEDYRATLSVAVGLAMRRPGDIK